VGSAAAGKPELIPLPHSLDTNDYMPEKSGNKKPA
jgi:hypothetical protein